MKKHLNLFILFAATTFFLTSCDMAGIGIEGEGDPVTEEFFLDDFDEFKIIGSFDVKLTQGETQSVFVTAQPNLIDRIDTDVSGDEWKIRYVGSVNSSFQTLIEITVPDIKAIKIAGSGNVVGQNDMELDNLEINISGSGDVDLFGTVNEQEIIIAGSGDINNFDLIAQETDVTISGSGDIETTSEEKLNVQISGSGDVRYKGDPSIDFESAGSGRLINAN